MAGGASFRVLQDPKFGAREECVPLGLVAAPRGCVWRLVALKTVPVITARAHDRRRPSDCIFADVSNQWTIRGWAL